MAGLRRLASRAVNLRQRIVRAEARVVVMGIGWTGLPLAVALAKAGFRVTGLDPDARKVALLSRGESYIQDVDPLAVQGVVEQGRLDATSEQSVLAQADVIVVCVPTPLNKTRDPDLSFILEATRQIAAHQRAGMLVVLESTTYPGTTREVLVPELTRRFDLGRDVYVAFSPERVDPGNREFALKNTPKVIAGATADCLQMATALYGHIVDTLVPVSSTDAAEMTKLLENTFRAVNIGLVNELALMCRHLDLDPFEVIRAAATKPFGYMPFWPGPGLGGQCIPVGPLYLSWKLRTLKYNARFIELADAINTAMPDHVVARAAQALNTRGKPLRGSSVLVYGVTYKRDVADIRESPGVDVLLGLKRAGAEVAYLDPFIPSLNEDELQLESIPASDSFAPWDLVVIVADHTALDRPRLVAQAQLVLDTRGTLGGIQIGAHNVIPL